jgi:hypothetical protein
MVGYNWVESRQSSFRREVELWEAIGIIIPSLFKLLEDGYSYVRSATFRTIDKFTEHGELPPDCVANQLMPI